MSKPLRVLMIEDSESDAVLLLEYLRQQGSYAVYSERVETADAMRKALKNKNWDIILSDYTLPTFSGPKALEVLKESRLDLPFIVVSGTVGEETAVEILKAGAHDFILKDKPVRLITAVERELCDARIRLEKWASEKSLCESEARFRQIVESNMIGIVFADQFDNITDTNDAFLNMIGYTRDEVLSGKIHWMSLSQETLYLDEESFKQSRTRWVFHPFEYRFEHKNGAVVEALIGGARLENDPKHAYVCFALDITQRKKAEKT